ncbi:MAG: ABC transporter substrate-binding protein [Pikeienuella sp.]|uniref:ABC transporter substrate-binding protein n=1 Tax=Pikeienuella sp. TaxID=2831957 RepID=UPI00391D3D22
MRRARAALLALLALAAPAAAEPERVVSVNLCTDQLAMLLAAPGQLVSVSHIAHDPLSSAMLEEAQAFPANYGRAEEVWLLRPDLVLAGAFTPETTVSMLRRMGVRVERFPLVTRLADVPGAIRAVGAALGREAEAEREAEAFEARLAGLKGRRAGADPRAALWRANGWSLGPETLAGDILATAGLANVAAELGLAAGGRIPLESLAMASPDLVLSGARYPGASEGEAITSHPALRHFRRGAVEDRDWVCGAPAALRAVSAMIEARRSLRGEEVARR